MFKTIRPIILAAGKGTRMGSTDRPKVLTPLNGRPIISYILETLKTGSFGRPALVIGFHADQVREALGSENDYILQMEQRGTGHAVRVCRETLAGTADAFMVMYGDQPLVTVKTLQRLIDRHQESGAALTLATLKTNHPSFDNFGRILRDADDEILGIREVKDCSPDEREITEYNPGLYCFSDAWLWGALDQIKPANAQGEYYLTDLLAIAIQQGQKTASVQLTEWHEALGVNTPEQLAEVEALLSSDHNGIAAHAVNEIAVM